MFSGGMKWEYWPEMGKKHCNNAFKAINEGSRTLLLSLHKFRFISLVLLFSPYWHVLASLVGTDILQSL